MRRLQQLGTTRRRGITIVEVVMAAGMLAVLLTVAVQMLGVLAVRQRSAERRTLATETVQAVAEQLGNLRWEELTPAAAESVALPESAQSYLRGAKLQATVVEETEPVASKRIQVELTWAAPGGEPAGPVRLTIWAFADETAAE